MKSNALFGCLIAVCAIGCVVVPASARSGGGGAAFAAGVHGGLRAGGHAFLRGPHQIFAHGFTARRAFRGIDARRQRISVLPSWLANGDFDPFYYYPPTDPAVISTDTAATPIAPSQQPPNRVLVVAPGCRTQEQTVHSEAGGTQIVHITRCY
jgi:hypothetical protein